MNPTVGDWLLSYYKHFNNEVDNTSFVLDENNLYQELIKSPLVFGVAYIEQNYVHPDFDKWNFRSQFKIVFSYWLFKIASYQIRISNNQQSPIDYCLENLQLKNISDLETWIEQICKVPNKRFITHANDTHVWAFLWLLDWYYRPVQKLDKTEIQNKIIQSMILAALSNNDVSTVEHKLIERYIEHSSIEKDRQQVLNKYLTEKIIFDKPNYQNEPYIIRKIAYDLSLLALMTDYEIEESELTYINQLADQLNIDLKAQYATFSIIQHLHLNCSHQLPYMQKTYSLNAIKHTVSYNFKYIVKKNASMIVNEIKESKELLSLLRKSVDENLSEEERKKLKAQAVDLLKTIPSLAIFMIPGGSILLPIILKILPPDLLYPSSFLNDKDKD
ncbi:MAG: DUF533 domain-containing protein [Bacteroidales bacterium]|nr:DUF533 domain-containing protein [Bacteroidales bacterium]